MILRRTGDSDGGGYEGIDLRDTTPCSSEKQLRWLLDFTPVSCSAYCLYLKMEDMGSSEISVYFSTDYTVLYPRRQNSS
jgi:hypothetical protein